MERVARCCERAAADGVHAGMTLTHARALIAEGAGGAEGAEGAEGAGAPHVEPVDAARELRALKRLATWALRFSPIVAVDPPDGLLMDIAGCERLFHGERRLVNLVGNSVAGFGVRGRVATAETYGGAWAVARFGDAERTVVAAGSIRSALASLPIEGLRLEPAACDALHEVGIVTIDEILTLPRLELATRFEPDVLLRIDQALGEAFETIEPVRRIGIPRVERSFDGPVRALEGIMQTVQDLVDGLVRELAQRESGATALELTLVRANSASVRETLALSRPSRSARHLWSLLRPRVERINLGFGIESITLAAPRVGRLRHAQSQRWCSGDAAGSPGADDRSLGELLDVLAGRIGREATVRAELVESHVPERAFRVCAAVEAGPLRRDRAGTRERGAACTASERPSILLDPSEPIDVIALVPDGPPSRLRWRNETLRVTASFGPERIEGEWWGESDEATERRSDEGETLASVATCASARDYFRIQDEKGRWLWIYRALESGRWFLHGEWA